MEIKMMTFSKRPAKILSFILFCSLLAAIAACNGHGLTGPDIGAYNEEKGIRIYVDRFVYSPSQTVKITVENRTSAMLSYNFCPTYLEKYDSETETWSHVWSEPETGDELWLLLCTLPLGNVAPKGTTKLYVPLRDEEEGVYRFKLPTMLRNTTPVETEVEGFLTTSVFRVER